MATDPQKIKIFGQGNQKLFKFLNILPICLTGKTECTGFTLWNKTDWISGF